MGLMDLLAQVVNGSATPEQHFDEVANNVAPELLGHGLAEAFRSDQTPAIGQMVGQLFGQSNSVQQAGLINHLLATVGPALLAGAAGGVLSRVLSPGAAQITPEQASRLDPSQVQDIVTHAQQARPGIADELGQFYAQHSGLVKTLGGAALVIALAKMKERMSQG